MNYNVGDRVKIKSLDWYNENKSETGCVLFTYVNFMPEMSQYCGKILTINRVIEGFGQYLMSECVFLWTDGMIEGLVEETKFGTASNPIEPKSNANSITQSEVDVIEEAKTYWDSIKDAWICPQGYIFKDENGNVINATKIVLEKKKKEYPKTYEECCKVMNYCYNPVATKTTHKEELIRKFQFLLLYRDAYWKIAGDEMGLGKPWEPDYDSGVNKYGIICMNGVIQESNPTTNWERHLNKILDFPTKEMRDAFKENFDPDIEICKEFL